MFLPNTRTVSTPHPQKNEKTVTLREVKVLKVLLLVLGVDDDARVAELRL
jgi:hypothetical protein